MPRCAFVLSGFILVQLLIAPATATALEREGPDWPVKANIEPGAPALTPQPGQELAISYNCGLVQQCTLSDFMERMHVCALFITKDGEPVLHRTAVRSDTDECKRAVERERYGIASISKSIVSLLFGLTHRDPAYGKPIDIDTPAGDLLADAGLEYPNPNVTIRDLLHMSSGMKWSEDEVDTILKISVNADGSLLGWYRTLKEAVKARLQQASFHERRQFHYSGFDTQLIGILTEHRIASDQRFRQGTLDAALEHLVWQKLPMTRYAEWNADFEGHPAAHCCAYTSAGDLATLGGWVLQEYNEGKRPAADWIRDSINDTVDPNWSCEFQGSSLEFLYGYQWWIPSGDGNGFTAIGIQGQYLHIFPEQGVVIAQIGEQIA
jgi:CubicO group peptidase (beta-lactamase class C family)